MPVEKKKLLIIGKLPPPYMGPSVAFEILIRSELKEQFDLRYLDIKANETLDTLGKFSFSKIRKNISVYKKFSEMLSAFRPDIVLIPISQTTLGFLKDAVFIWLCKRQAIKSVIQLRGSNFRKWIESSSFPVRKFVAHILKMPEGVIVLGNKLKYLFENYFSDDRIFVVPNGADYPVVAKNNGSNEKTTFVYLANLQSSKGIRDVLQAAKLLAQQQLPFRLFVAGQWRDEATRIFCEKLVSENQLPVTFFPPLKGKEKFDYLASGDVFVFTPREPEGHPWVIIEAMSAGLPVISTDQGAITESVSDGLNGFIVPAGSPESIALKMAELITDQGKRVRMGEMSRKFYEDRFTESRMVANMARVLSDLAG
ncbi:MAG TPA: glycosyltransferase family 4 protein [Bacteroidia bacterium]|nr:glycosyltransferase family 4 protein [Bacteroidia bacterium]